LQFYSNVGKDKIFYFFNTTTCKVVEKDHVLDRYCLRPSVFEAGTGSQECFANKQKDFGSKATGIHTCFQLSFFQSLDLLLVKHITRV